MWVLLSTRYACTPSMPSSAGPISSPPLVLRPSPSAGPESSPSSPEHPQAEAARRTTRTRAIGRRRRITAWDPASPARRTGSEDPWIGAPLTHPRTPQPGRPPRASSCRNGSGSTRAARPTGTGGERPARGDPPGGDGRDGAGGDGRTVHGAEHDRVAHLAPPAPHLDPQAADPALGVGPAQHRQAGGERSRRVAASRAVTRDTPGNAGTSSRASGRRGPVAVGAADRVGEEAQLAARPRRPAAPRVVPPVEADAPQGAVVLAGAGRSARCRGGRRGSRPRWSNWPAACRARTHDSPGPNPAPTATTTLRSRASACRSSRPSTAPTLSATDTTWRPAATARWARPGGGPAGEASTTMSAAERSGVVDGLGPVAERRHDRGPAPPVGVVDEHRLRGGVGHQVTGRPGTDGARTAYQDPRTPATAGRAR